MTKKSLYSLWGVLFIICAGLGFIPEPPEAARWVFTLLSVLFFLPPAVLVYRAGKREDVYTLKFLRNLSLASLCLTLTLLVGNLLTALRSEFLGNVLYGILIIVSCPMVCSGYWVLSLFLWACLRITALGFLRKYRK